MPRNTVASNEVMDTDLNEAIYTFFELCSLGRWKKYKGRLPASGEVLIVTMRSLSDANHFVECVNRTSRHDITPGVKLISMVVERSTVLRPKRMNCFYTSNAGEIVVVTRSHPATKCNNTIPLSLNTIGEGVKWHRDWPTYGAGRLGDGDDDDDSDRDSAVPSPYDDFTVSPVVASSMLRVMTKSECATCHKVCHRRCTECKVTHYCDVGCQRRDWLTHRSACLDIYQKAIKLNSLT